MSRFKTELCNNLMELGNCKYGDRCHYAHGAHELRQVSRRHPKYRTERCKNFELTGKCPFGPRCSYVHPKPDLDSMIEQLTRYVQHTKAPKPDSEDDEDETNINSLFSRTATSSSLLSQCESSVSSNSNHQFLIDESNKENQLIADFHYYTAPTSKFEEDFKSSTEQKVNYIDNPFVLNSQQPSILETHKPLTTSTHNEEAFEQRPPLASSINLTIQRPQQPPRIAMRALSSNSQSRPQDQVGTNTNCNNSSRPSSSSSSSTFDKTITSSNSFGINNLFCDYFNQTGPVTDGVTSAPNKQFYTRF